MNKRRSRRTARKKHRSMLPPRGRYVGPRTAEEFFSKPEEFQDEWNRSLHVVSRMRADRLSLPQASHEYGIEPRKVLKLARPALRKRKGRWVVTYSDRLLRVLVVLTRDGLREFAVRDSRQASVLAEYWDAVQRYLQRGDDLVLRKFRGVRIEAADGESIPLLTEREELDRLGNAGVLSFESLYARSA
jgi:hypothetical protein